MLLMEIWTWKPEKRDEVERRFSEWKCPEGITERGSWLDLRGNRFFFLSEIDDPKVILAANHDWTDIAKVDFVPVMEDKEVMKMMQKKD